MWDVHVKPCLLRQPFEVVSKQLSMLPQFRFEVEMVSGFDLCNWPLPC